MSSYIFQGNPITLYLYGKQSWGIEKHTPILFWKNLHYAPKKSTEVTYYVSPPKLLQNVRPCLLVCPLPVLGVHLPPCLNFALVPFILLGKWPSRHQFLLVDSLVCVRMLWWDVSLCLKLPWDWDNQIVEHFQISNSTSNLYYHWDWCVQGKMFTLYT